ncbi:MAG: ComEC family competence protein [Cytophagales bacterium]|nr:ComEC family competence protein [Cytophagales bacterium]
MWGIFPFARYVFFLILGIISYVFFYESWLNLLLITLSISSLLLFLFWKKKQVTIAKFCLPISFFTVGYLLTLVHTDHNYSSHFSHFSFDKYEVIVSSEAIQKSHASQMEIKVQQIYTNGHWQKSFGKIRLNLKDQSLPKYGQKLLISKRPKKILPPQNPHEFDYKRYSSFHNIEYKSTLETGDYKLVGSPSFTFIALAHTFRKHLVQKLKQQIKGKNEFSILSALLLGDKQYLGNELKTQYAGAGAMHILAVSGLHVGVLLGALQFLLVRISFFRQRAIFKNILLILFLWAYACITGFSPSVLRASTMFSFVLIANAINRNSNIYNTLSLTGFCLLLYNPYYIMEVGFQLSFLAVLGIVFLFDKFYALFNFRYKLTKYIWGLFCISISATLSTAPITLLYFHQFPTYFFLVNLLIIPLAMGLVIGGFISLLFSFWEWGFSMACWVLEKLTCLLNQIISYSQEQLPFSQITGIHIEIWESYLLYFILISTSLFFLKKRLIYLTSTVILVCILSIWNSYEIRQEQEQNMVSFYHTSYYPNLIFCNKNKHWLLSSQRLIENKSSLKFHFLHDWWAQGTKEQEYINTQINNKFQRVFNNYNLVMWDNKSFLIIKKKLSKKEEKALQNVHFDYMINFNSHYYQPTLDEWNIGEYVEKGFWRKHF